jgi:phosphatidylserine/phosphatidylglycerophosphate/cardiolipin synthase-like enzyme
VEPSDKGAALLAAINAAKKSVHMTMYLLTSTDIEDALVSAKKRGLEVKVVLNKNFPAPTSTTNASAYSTLSKAGIGVVYASTDFTYTHEKCVIIDGNEAWIMTMNLSASAATSNREYIAIDDDAQDVAEAEAIFAADYAMTSYKPSGKLVVAPNNARSLLLQFIATAKSKIDLEDEEFSDTNITAALAAKCSGGIPTRIVLADASTTAQATALQSLKAAGCKVVITTSPYIHAKTIVIDGANAFIGSENLTTPSLMYNRELGLFLNKASEVAKILKAIDTDYAKGTAQ